MRPYQTLGAGRAKVASKSKINVDGWTWNRIAARVKLRDVVCQWQDGSCSGRFEVDHIVSRFVGGTDDLSNLRLLCRSHHVRRHNGLTGPEVPKSPLQVRGAAFGRRVW